MPIMPNGCFKSYSEIRADVDGTRNINREILRLADERGITDHPAIPKAKEELDRVDRLEREYLMEQVA